MKMLNDHGYYQAVIDNIKLVRETQTENIKTAAKLMADAIEQDRLINVYGEGGIPLYALVKCFSGPEGFVILIRLWKRG